MLGTKKAAEFGFSHDFSYIIYCKFMAKAEK
jgi:hypothetical protein